METTQQQKYQNFKALHECEGAFVMPNPWDAGSAIILEQSGFKALATTSAGYAFSAGQRDAAGVVTRADILANARAIIAATSVPVSADLEDGFGLAPDICHETISLAIKAGLVGGSIEDASSDADTPILPLDIAVERIKAAASATHGQPFMLTARAENYLWGNPDLDDTIQRLQAFDRAGADVLYAPGLDNLDDIRTLCSAVDKPVNVVMGLHNALFSIEQLAEAGVKRISVGGSFARAAYGALIRVATEVKDHGTFTYARDAISDRVINQMMSAEKRASRT
ncbi:isocitrate lyase/PEP mutase family protein [Candidatus Puniceispirillum sp.]|uniref:isocitrate lyase/PEP mutase family protein n=1 Tax=Candidatus Puniceispirillum sp. TaxID=2026719 RepID=UPI001ECBC38A|nr:isocitrate lyase/phosphoenolpyruvate mutase family protein [Candidatus Puniceispirillum sp.]